MMLLVSSVLADTVSLSGPVPDDGVDFFTLSFEVPEGTAEIEVAHSSLGEGDILDWGLLAPSGFRGWGGGNTENAVVGADAASRSYLAGPIEPGTWQVLVGKAKLVSDAPSYAVDVTVRDAPTLAAEPARRDYAEVDLGGGARWYAGELAIAEWDALCDDGPCPAALGGSDDHRAGAGTGPFDSPIGSPTTLVWAESLSPTDLIEGIRAGRTVVKLQGPEDPMVELSADGLVVTAVVTGGVGTELHLVVDGEVADDVDVDADPFTYTAEIAGDRVRAEVWEDNAPRTVTSHVFPEAEALEVPAEDCGCTGIGAPNGLAAALALVLWVRRRRPV